MTLYDGGKTVKPKVGDLLIPAEELHLWHIERIAPDRANLREHLVANLFDGDDAGRVTFDIATFVGEVVEVVNDWLATPDRADEPFRGVRGGDDDPDQYEPIEHATPDRADPPAEFYHGHDSYYEGCEECEAARLATPDRADPPAFPVGQPDDDVVSLPSRSALRAAIIALPRHTSPDGEETWVEWAALRDLLDAPEPREVDYVAGTYLASPPRTETSAATPDRADLVPHDHEALGCEYPCDVVAGALEPRR